MIGDRVATLTSGTVPRGYPWYVWWIGPILGAIVAALIYDYGVLGKRMMKSESEKFSDRLSSKHRPL